MVVSAFQNWINLFALHGNLALSPMLLYRPIHFVFICHQWLVVSRYLSKFNGMGMHPCFRQGLKLKGLIVIVEAIRGHIPEYSGFMDCLGTKCYKNDFFFQKNLTSCNAIISR